MYLIVLADYEGRTNKLIQFRGIGAVLRDGYEVAIVRYDLRKVVDIVKAWNEVSDGLSYTIGTITMLEGDIQMSDGYVLRLEDWRTIEFFAIDTSTERYPNIKYHIKGSGEPKAESPTK